jgi:hypothetical protein
MKILIFANDMLIWGKDNKETKDKLKDGDYVKFKERRHRYQNKSQMTTVKWGGGGDFITSGS